jgi:glyoxylate reductase
VIKILITKKIHPIAKELLKQHFLVDENDSDMYLTPESLKQAVKTHEGILCTIYDRFDAQILKEATVLRVISNLGIGVDNIDLAFAQSKGIKVYNLPDVTTQSVADLTFSILLALIRKIPQAQEFVRQDLWKAWDPTAFIGEELYGKTFGILGFGHIGKAVAKRALGFGLEVIFYNRSRVSLEGELKGLKQVEWEELLMRSDYLSLHVPLTEETRGIINLKAFEQMKKKPVLINAARGTVVDTDALIVALEKGMIRGAALDVTSPEPLSGHHPLCMFENCLIVPHIGSSTLECHREMSHRAAQNLIDFFKK